MGFRCSTGQLAIVLELVAKIASEQARDLALHISRMSIKVLLEHVDSMAKMLSQIVAALCAARWLFVIQLFRNLFAGSQAAAWFPRSVCGFHL